jgi:hypothetical protein
MILTRFLYDPPNQRLNHWEVYLLSEVFLVSVELGKGFRLAQLQALLVEQQNRDVLINTVFIFRTLFDEPIDKIETYLKNIFMLLF